MFHTVLTALAALVAMSTPAFAHVTGEAQHSFASGFTHPIFGADHVLAMVAVGLWASQIAASKAQKAALWVVPLAFVSFMAFGFMLALMGVQLPWVEPAILASVIALGLLTAIAVRVPTASAAAVVGLFAIFHGFAHGTEMHGADALGYGLGFIASTMLLHAAGIALGFGLSQLGARLSRLAGALTALAGVSLAFGG